MESREKNRGFVREGNVGGDDCVLRGHPTVTDTNTAILLFGFVATTFLVRLIRLQLKAPSPFPYRGGPPVVIFATSGGCSVSGRWSGSLPSLGISKEEHSSAQCPCFFRHTHIITLLANLLVDSVLSRASACDDRNKCQLTGRRCPLQQGGGG